MAGSPLYDCIDKLFNKIIQDLMHTVKVVFILGCTFVMSVIRCLTSTVFYKITNASKNSRTGIILCLPQPSLRTYITIPSIIQNSIRPKRDDNKLFTHTLRHFKGLCIKLAMVICAIQMFRWVDDTRALEQNDERGKIAYWKLKEISIVLVTSQFVRKNNATKVGVTAR